MLPSPNARRYDGPISKCNLYRVRKEPSNFAAEALCFMAVDDNSLPLMRAFFQKVTQSQK